VPFFAKLSPDTIIGLIRLLRSRITVPEEIVIKQGMQINALFFCLRGTLDVWHEPEGEERAGEGASRVMAIVGSNSRLCAVYRVTVSMSPDHAPCTIH
jgi:hypothetical protein